MIQQTDLAEGKEAKDFPPCPSVICHLENFLVKAEQVIVSTADKHCSGCANIFSVFLTWKQNTATMLS